MSAVDVKPLAARLRYDDDAHRYWIDDREVSGITRVLERGGVKERRNFPTSATTRGTAVHLALQYLAEGDLDLDALHPRLRGYLDAFARFSAENDWCTTEPPELLVGNELLNYATRIDAVGILRSSGLTVINYKSGAHARWHAVQSAGEALGYLATRPERCTTAIARASLYLHHDGTYQLRPNRDRHDFNVFRAACVIAAWNNDAPADDAEGEPHD